MKPTKVEPTFPSQPAALAGAPVGTLALPKIPSDSGLYTNQNVPPPYPGMEIETKMGGTRTVLVTRPASYAEDDDDEGCDGFDIDENFKLDDAPTSELSALVGTSPPSSSAASSSDAYTYVCTERGKEDASPPLQQPNRSSALAHN